MKYSIPPETHMDRLKIAATYLSVQRGLRRSAWGSLGWGAFTLAIGLLFSSHTFFDYVWLLVGTFLVIEGVWILRSIAADPRVLLMEAFALLTLGLLNTVGLYLEIESGIRPVFGGRVILVGIVQLISAYTTYKSYPVYSQVYEYLDRACLHELEMHIGDMWKKKSELEPDLADFKLDNKKCKAKFLPEQLIMLVNDGKDVTITERIKVNLDKSKKKMLSKVVKVELIADGEKLKAEMKPEDLEKWQAWGSQQQVNPGTILNQVPV
jgi:hypothetical protein